MSDENPNEHKGPGRKKGKDNIIREWFYFKESTVEAYKGWEPLREKVYELVEEHMKTLKNESDDAVQS